MPSNKKKGKARKADRAAALARRADKNIVDSLPPFGPVKETHEEELKRIIGYKHLSIPQGSENEYSDQPVSVTRKAKDNDSDRLFVQILSHDMKPIKGKYVEFAVPEGRALWNKFVPDYDRNAAEYPVAREIMRNTSSSRVDTLTRRVKKCIHDVPPESMDVFTAFMNRGEGIYVSCMKTSDICTDIDLTGARGYCCVVGLTDDIGEDSQQQKFLLFLSKKGGGDSGSYGMSYAGCLSSKCLHKYQRELALLLTHECFTRVSSGNANLVDGISRDEFSSAIAKALCSMYAEKGRWTDLAGLHSVQLEQATEAKLSLTVTTGIEYRLGEALEADKLFSQAAQVYAEAARYLHDAAHPKTATTFTSAGLAWKRHGDYHKAESYYALSLESLLRFVHDPVEYKSSVFNTLRNLYILYLDSEINIAPLKLVVTLRELLIATGTMSPDEDRSQFQFLDRNIPNLRASFQNMTKEQACRVIQSIIAKTKSVETMREAIFSCANPATTLVEMMHSSSSGGRGRQNKDDARDFIRGNYATTGFLASCDACGTVKEERKFEQCPCKNAYYCDSRCQKAHWPEHKHEFHRTQNK